MWLINPATAFPDPVFRLIWLIELLVVLLLILSALRFSRRAWIGSTILLVIGLVALVPGFIYQLRNPDYIGAMIDIPLLLMFPVMAASVVWAAAAWIMRLSRKRRRATSS